MPAIWIRLDEATFKRLKRVLPAANRTEFVTRAIREAVCRAEFAYIRTAYLKQPDSAADADDWSTAERFERIREVT